MFTAPAATPVTTPVAAFTVALAVLLLLHVPPGVASAKVMEEPGHTEVGPVMEATEVPAFMVSALVATAVPQLVVTV
jgi:hypothetical protein